jgi:hypothetical protein
MWHPTTEATSADAVQAKTVALPQQDASGEYIDEAADYMMLDNHEIYAYLAEN